MQINIFYDASVTDLDDPENAAYNPALYAKYTNAATLAATFYDTEFVNNDTVSVTFGWGDVPVNGGSPLSIGGGDSGESSWNSIQTTYGSMYAALKDTYTSAPVQVAALASLPMTDPTGGAGIELSLAQANVLGFSLAQSYIGGGVGLNTSENWSWTQAATTSDESDAVGTLEHEISEVLGRHDDGGAGDNYTPLDFFRYTATDGGATDAPGTAVGARDEPFQQGYSADAFSYFSYNGSTITLPYETPSDVAAGADIGDWAPSVHNDSYADGGPDGPNPVSQTDLEEMEVLGYELACFLRGTGIATPRGEVPVERLAVGDRVLTYSGAVRNITWIGTGKALAPAGRRNDATPVIVHKGALSDGVPHRTLGITKGHSLYVDGVLIPVEFLVNHRSIVWDDRGQEVEVFHIELDSHDVLLANGAPAESYRDEGNRWLFRNGNEAAAPEQPPYAPVLTGGPGVDAAWRRLLDRVRQPLEADLTAEPDVHLMVNGARVDGVPAIGMDSRLNDVSPDRVLFFRLQSPRSVRIVSRADAQDVVGFARDPRVLGVAVRRIVLWRGHVPIIIDASDRRLGRGFHAFEAENGWRWTDGDAVLPASKLDGIDGPCELELYLAGSARYRVTGSAARRPRTLVGRIGRMSDQIDPARKVA